MCVSQSLQIRGICISGSLFYEPQFLKHPKIILSFLQHRCFNTKTPHRNVGFLPAFFVNISWQRWSNLIQTHTLTARGDKTSRGVQGQSQKILYQRNRSSRPSSSSRSTA